MSRELKCREVVELLAQYLEGSLPDESRQALEAHLEVCQDCRTYASSYKTTIELARAACASDEATVPDDLLDAILETRSIVG